jgi:hypothetical protein
MDGHAEKGFVYRQLLRIADEFDRLADIRDLAPLAGVSKKSATGNVRDWRGSELRHATWNGRS